MIVRILGEGQRELPDSEHPRLDDLDNTLLAAVEAGDAQGFAEALAALHDHVRAVGTEVASDALVPSDLVLPSADAGLDEVRALLGEEGLISG